VVVIQTPNGKPVCPLRSRCEPKTRTSSATTRRCKKRANSPGDVSSYSGPGRGRWLTSLRLLFLRRRPLQWLAGPGIHPGVGRGDARGLHLYRRIGSAGARRNPSSEPRGQRVPETGQDPGDPQHELPRHLQRHDLSAIRNRCFGLGQGSTRRPSIVARPGDRRRLRYGFRSAPNGGARTWRQGDRRRPSLVARIRAT
jgi:hypothetical protein